MRVVGPHLRLYPEFHDDGGKLPDGGRGHSRELVAEPGTARRRNLFIRSDQGPADFALAWTEVVMKLTRASSYALQAVTFIAQERSTAPVGSHKIAEARKIPPRFLLKVLKPLVTIRVLQSIKGPKGGYRLARPASEISMLEIIEAVDHAPIAGINPLDDDGKGNAAVNARLETICKQTAEAVRKHLETVRLSDLLGKDTTKRR